MAITWGSEQSSSKSTVSNSEQTFTAVDASSAYLTQFNITVDNLSLSVTDVLIVRIYLSTDGTNFDDLPWRIFEIVPDGVGEEQLSEFIPMCYYWQIGVESSGSTDDYDVDLDYRLLTAL